jgi:SAM-dependent methyltransferase
MQAYSEKFSLVYNLRWGRFAENAAPRIMDFYEATPTGRNNKTLLDVCCGTGQLAVHFLRAGYKVAGLDSSESMLHYARENAGSYVDAGQARFIQGDASRFTLEERFGLIVSTFDALNHLDNEERLGACFRSVFPMLIEGGFFIFDLNTRFGLQRWNNISIDDSGEELMAVTRGNYDGQADKAWTRVTGLIRRPDGLCESFDEAVFNTVFDLARVKDRLFEIGWHTVHFAHMDDLQTPLAEPEQANRVFVIAGK